MIDIDTEKLLTTNQARHEPVFQQPDGRPCAMGAIYRHFNGQNRRGLRLEYIDTPRGRRTSREAIERFISAWNGKPTARTSKQRAKAVRDADRELEAMGI